DNAAKDEDQWAGRPCCRNHWRGTGGMGLLESRNGPEMELLGVVEGVNGNVKGVNWEEPDFSTIIAQQLQNLLPAMLAQILLCVISICAKYEQYKYVSKRQVNNKDK
ncbi:hypothetical protein Tco_0293742, partial [Tanacetum coccineum]